MASRGVSETYAQAEAWVLRYWGRAGTAQKTVLTVVFLFALAVNLYNGWSLLISAVFALLYPAVVALIWTTVGYVAGRVRGWLGASG